MHVYCVFAHKHSLALYILPYTYCYAYMHACMYAQQYAYGSMYNARLCLCEYTSPLPPYHLVLYILIVFAKCQSNGGVSERLVAHHPCILLVQSPGKQLFFSLGGRQAEKA